jgi:hypothetical protein
MGGVKASLARPAIFGAFNGTASLLGVIIFLLLSHPSLISPRQPQGRSAALSAWAAASSLAIPTTG